MALEKFTDETAWAKAATDAGLHGPHAMQGFKQSQFVDNRGMTAAQWDGATDTGWVDAPAKAKATVIHSFHESQEHTDGNG